MIGRIQLSTIGPTSGPRPIADKWTAGFIPDEFYLDRPKGESSSVKEARQESGESQVNVSQTIWNAFRRNYIELPTNPRLVRLHEREGLIAVRPARIKRSVLPTSRTLTTVSILGVIIFGLLCAAMTLSRAHTSSGTSDPIAPAVPSQ